MYGSPNDEPDEDYDAFVERIRDQAVKAYSDVRVSLQRSDLRNKKYYDLSLKPKQFEVGEWVLYFNPRKFRGKQMKWMRQYEGPFLVIEKPSRLTAKIQRTAKAKPKVVHVDKLKHFQGKAPKVWTSPAVTQEVVNETYLDNSPDVEVSPSAEVVGKPLPQKLVSPGGLSEELFSGTEDSLRHSDESSESAKVEPHTGGSCVGFSGDRFRPGPGRREASSGVGDAESSSVDVFRTGNGRSENRNEVLESVDNSGEDIVSADGCNTREVEFRPRQQPSRNAKRPARHNDYHTQFAQPRSRRTESNSGNAAKDTTSTMRGVSEGQMTHTRIFVNTRYKYANLENPFTVRSESI